MTFTEHTQMHFTPREWQLSEKIDELFIADAERVCAEQSNSKYRLMRNDVIRLIESYSDLPISRVLAILNFESELWTKA
jgi:hypothetical protein